MTEGMNTDAEVYKDGDAMQNERSVMLGMMPDWFCKMLQSLRRQLLASEAD